jgi:hypothetical protein
MTMFGDDSDVAKFQAAKVQGLTDKEALQLGDNGVGSPSLGKLNTNNKILIGGAIPLEVLKSTLGDSPAAWRSARIDVVDLNTGQRMRMPLVDVGKLGGSGERLTGQGSQGRSSFQASERISMHLLPNRTCVLGVRLVCFSVVRV